MHPALFELTLRQIDLPTVFQQIAISIVVDRLSIDLQGEIALCRNRPGLFVAGGILDTHPDVDVAFPSGFRCAAKVDAVGFTQSFDCRCLEQAEIRANSTITAAAQQSGHGYCHCHCGRSL